MAFVRILVTILVLWFISGSEAFRGSYRRKKRIIYGVLINNDRELAYPAIRYTVWIGNGMLHPNRDDFQEMYMDEISAAPKHLWCGGVLITPDIVQTACTCVSFFILDEEVNGIARAHVMNSWEFLLEVFMSETRVSKMEWFVLSKSFVVFQQCKRIYLRTKTPTDTEHPQYVNYVIHDYGLILLQKKVIEIPPAEISYAPASTFEDIIRYYYEALKQEYVCLFFGWGHQNETKTYGIRGWGNNSNFLRFGWRPLINYQDCYWATYHDPVEQPPSSKEFVYTRDATWACANSYRVRSAPEADSTSSGDRGGPVSCNNEYFGIISSSFWIKLSHVDYSLRRPNLKLTLTGPIVFTLWENSINYRERFIEDLHEKLKPGWRYPDPIDEMIRYRPTHKLQTFSRTQSISSSIYFILFFASMSSFLSYIT